MFPVSGELEDEAALRSRIPELYRLFVAELMERFGVSPPKEGGAFSPYGDNLVYSIKDAREKFNLIFEHDVRLYASALGPAPADLVEQIHDKGSLVAGMVGKPGQAARHVNVGSDIIVAQGTEAGGHTGEISTFVLVPQVVEEVPGVPVLAAGGVGHGRQIAASLALGAEGVWTGSIWLTTRESDVDEIVIEKLLQARSTDTIRSRALTGKPSRQLRTDWVEAWESEDAPEPLAAPLQGLLVRDAIVGIAEHRVEPLMGTPAGQVIGMTNQRKAVRNVVFSLVAEYVDELERLADNQS